MVTIIIPAHNEVLYLNRTIDNAFTTCRHRPQVIVIDQGGNGTIDSRAEVITPDTNIGERAAMNQAAALATNTHLLRIDAHCDVLAPGWDELMCRVTPDGVMTQAVLTACRLPWDQLPEKERANWLKSHTKEEWPQWQRIPGHAYIRCRLLPTMEAKWHNPNKSEELPDTIPNMSSTGCGFLMTKSWYNKIGGADETLPPMGAIGEEFSIKTWFYGGRVQTITSVVIGHVFGTSKTGYPTDGVRLAQQGLAAKYSSCYDKVRSQFPDMAAELEDKLKSTLNIDDNKHIVTVTRTDVTTHRDSDNREILKVESIHEYKWLDDGSGLTDAQVEARYKDKAILVTRNTYVKDLNDKWVIQEEEAEAVEAELVEPNVVPMLQPTYQI